MDGKYDLHSVNIGEATTNETATNGRTVHVVNLFQFHSSRLARVREGGLDVERGKMPLHGRYGVVWTGR
jgi:hypothetical protein